MKVGAPFNPYRVFQGVFAPYWILEHTRLGAGAKLCYVRLLDFAGKDARCYPAPATLGSSLGVSERQAREYVRELEKAGLIAVEQRGLRKTNLYVFLWTQELEDLSSSLPERPDDPNDPDGGLSGTGSPDRENSSGQDRNSAPAPDRKKTAGQDRKTTAGPIGIDSPRITTVESSSSPTAPVNAEDENELLYRTAQAILDWANSRGLQRFRSDRQVGPPEKKHLTQWAANCATRGIDEPKAICAIMDTAREAADRSGDWRAWSYLTIQVQLAVERNHLKLKCNGQAVPACPRAIEAENDCEWTQAKAALRAAIPPIAFSNWFIETRQVQRSGPMLTVSVPNEPTRDFLESEYRDEVLDAVSLLGIDRIQFVVM